MRDQEHAAVERVDFLRVRRTACAPSPAPYEVRCGVNSAFVYRALTDGTRMYRRVFGDPIYGSVKCRARRRIRRSHGVDLLRAGTRRLRLPGTTEVRCGANGAYIYRTLTDGTACTNEVFGDPLYSISGSEISEPHTDVHRYRSGPLPGPTSQTGPDGALWFTDTLHQGAIGRITTSGVVTYSLLPDADPVQHPTGKFPFSITAGSDGAVWFTELWGSKIGRISWNALQR